jgi:hypothetical protein
MQAFVLAVIMGKGERKKRGVGNNRNSYVGRNHRFK